MFPIYLLEDDVTQQAEYERIIKNTIMINEYAMELVIATDSPKQLMKQMDNPKEGLFFLDMEIGEDDQAGLELASKVREKLPFAQIVFITTHDELSFLTLERRISPLDYILKDQSTDIIMQKIIKDINVTQKILEDEVSRYHDILGYKIGTRFFSVPMNEVIMLSTVKTRPGVVVLTAKNKQAEFPGNLNSYEEKYAQLFRCDKSTLISLECINNYDYQNREITLVGNIKCGVSFRKSRELNKILKNR